MTANKSNDAGKALQNRIPLINEIIDVFDSDISIKISQAEKLFIDKILLENITDELKLLIQINSSKVSILSISEHGTINLTCLKDNHIL